MADSTTTSDSDSTVDGFDLNPDTNSTGSPLPAENAEAGDDVDPVVTPNDNESQPDAENAASDGGVTSFNDAQSDESADGALNMTVTRDAFLSFISQIFIVCDEAILEFNPEGVECLTSDPGNVYGVHTEATAGMFEAFNAGTYQLGIDLEFIEGILSTFDSDEILDITPTSDHKLQITGTGGLEYTVAPINPETIRSLDEFPDIPHSVTATIDMGDLDTAIKAGNIIDEQLALEVSDNGIQAKMSDDSDTSEVDIADRDALSTTEGDLDPFEVKLSFEYLKEIVKGIPSDQFTLKLGEEVPLIFEGETEGGANNWTYMLAPKIETE